MLVGWFVMLSTKDADFVQYVHTICSHLVLRMSNSDGMLTLYVHLVIRMAHGSIAAEVSVHQRAEHLNKTSPN